MTRAAYIISAVRTPIGKFGGSLAELTAADLGVLTVRAALDRAFGELPPERAPGDRLSTPSSTRYHVDELLFRRVVLGILFLSAIMALVTVALG